MAKQLIKKSLLIGSFVLSFINPLWAQISVAFDPIDSYGLRQTVFGPFVSLGKIPVSENKFLATHSTLPKNIPDFWQVISVGKDVLINECTDSGRLMPLELNNFPHKDLLIPSAIEKCGIGHAVIGTVLAYSVMHKYGTPPNNWEDLFDFNRYPGKRSFPKQARHVMEIALLADGVKKEDLYSVLTTDDGQIRALKKLNTIYDEIIWWRDINELQSWLADGLVALAVAPDGAVLQGEGFDNIGISRNNMIYRMRYYAIPKSAKSTNIAYAFISFATQPTQQQNLTNVMPYGTTLKQGWTLVAQNRQESLTNYPKNLQNSLLEDYTFYAKNGVALEKRFNAWLDSKKVSIKRVTISTQSEIDEEENRKQQAIRDFVGPHPEERADSKPDFMGPMPQKKSVQPAPKDNKPPVAPPVKPN